MAKHTLNGTRRKVIKHQFRARLSTKVKKILKNRRRGRWKLAISK
jgi:ribosomal protein L34